MTWELKRIPLGPVAKVGFILYFAMSLALFLIYALLLGGMLDMVGQLVGEETGLPAMSGGAMIFFGFFLAIFLAVLYTCFTLLAALIYNAVASFVGGVMLELNERPAVMTTDS